MDLNMKVNVIPALTYNRLQLNGSSINENGIDINLNSTPAPEKLPEGVEVQKGVDGKTAEVIFEKYRQAALKADEGLSKPNGDMSYRNDAQATRTGMGIDVDELLERANIKADVYNVKDNTKVSEPLVIHYELSDGDGSLSRQIIHLGKESELTVVMFYESEEDTKGFQGVSTKILAENGSKLKLFKVQKLGNKYIHFDDFGGVADDDAEVEIVQIELGALKNWNGVHITLFGKNSNFLDNTGYLCRGEQQYDMNYIAEHRGKKTNSEMYFRGVLEDNSQKAFRDTLDFKSGCAGAKGNEQEDTLLLSPEVINRSMPMILCQEEDVDGTHGATIGQLSEDILFYMNSRGIDEEAAKRLMVRARLESLVRRIPDGATAGKMQYFVQNLL
ncbi:MAG: SufD family Fe-S cluster assembly protein [Butyrivibrio sp.]|nr:SufD family Fe-S cluster assembly protein [Butyrivibrio sp.]